MSVAGPPPKPGAAGTPGAADGVVCAPTDVESMAPGVDLAGVLADLPAERIANGDVVGVMVAAHRLATHYRAVFFELVREVALRQPGPDDEVHRGTAAEVDEFTADEIAAALCWSRTRAQNTLGLAVELSERLPAVGSAMAAGQIDEPRAKAFADWTAGLSDEHSAAVVEQVLPHAPGMTVGQICQAIQRTTIALDPTWAQRRYDESVRRRKVVLTQGPDGTATLAGHELPADRAVAAHEYIVALSRRCKRAGDRRPIDLIRADLYIGMMDGTLRAMTDEQIIEYTLANPIAGDPTTDNPGDDGDDAGAGDGDQPGDDGGSEVRTTATGRMGASSPAARARARETRTPVVDAAEANLGTTSPVTAVAVSPTTVTRTLAPELVEAILGITSPMASPVTGRPAQAAEATASPAAPASLVDQATAVATAAHPSIQVPVTKLEEPEPTATPPVSASL